MPLVFESLFLEVTAILVVSAVIGALATQLRQPLIVAFIGVGVLVGPAGLDLVSAHEQIELLAELGIALLLFVVGLKLDLHLIRTTGPVALATGLGQVIFTSIFGFLIALGFGMGTVEALYLAVGLTFSSTIIIVKLLSDKREIDALHGRIALGFLIVQDVAAVLALIGLTALGAAPGGEGGMLREGLRVAGVGLAFLGVVGLLMRYALPPCWTASPAPRSSWCSGRSPGRCSWRPWATPWDSAKRWERSWRASRWPRPPTGRPSPRAC